MYRCPPPPHAAAYPDNGNQLRPRKVHLRIIPPNSPGSAIPLYSTEAASLSCACPASGNIHQHALPQTCHAPRRRRHGGTMIGKFILTASPAGCKYASSYLVYIRGLLTQNKSESVQVQRRPRLAKPPMTSVCHPECTASLGAPSEPRSLERCDAASKDRRYYPTFWRSWFPAFLPRSNTRRTR